jgi:hypothetical protein
MTNNKVWEAVPIDKIPEGTKIMTSAWAMKNKSNGTYRARINARGFEQVDGEHCNLDTKSSPVTCIVTIRIVMTLVVMSAWAAHLMDVHEALLKGKFRDGEVIYMKVPQGFEKYHPKNVIIAKNNLWIGSSRIGFWGRDSRSIRIHEIREKQGRSVPTLQMDNHGTCDLDIVGRRFSGMRKGKSCV